MCACGRLQVRALLQVVQLRTRAPLLSPVSTSRLGTMSEARTMWPKVVLFGDSLTQYSFSLDGCWGALVSDLLQRKCDVINRGFSGYNVRWCRLMLPQLVPKEVAKETVAITIFLGANDSNDFELNSRQHVPLEEYREGLGSMIDHLLSVGVSRDKIILISPPAFAAEAWEKQCIMKGKPLSKNNKTTGEYAKVCMSVAKEYGTQTVDLYTSMMKSPNWEEMLIDGLHLSQSGSKHLFDLLKPVMEQLTSNLPMKFPLWDQVDIENPKSSLLSQ
ncbi:hypothetical protein BaRGS_00006434 [Batillaria attramentaria]|uniref:Isoamyl acetate-hydrolyzing esterase 1 homolog n=1 Tax=Batillaria attramentaria TaxID=370345 RepID=A0ABD0LSL5_9CAEN